MNKYHYYLIGYSAVDCIKNYNAHMILGFDKLLEKINKKDLSYLKDRCTEDINKAQSHHFNRSNVIVGSISYLGHMTELELEDD